MSATQAKRHARTIAEVGELYEASALGKWPRMKPFKQVITSYVSN